MVDGVPICVLAAACVFHSDFATPKSPSKQNLPVVSDTKIRLRFLNLDA